MTEMITELLRLQMLFTESEWAASEMVYMITGMDSKRQIKELDPSLGWLKILYKKLCYLIDENKELKKQLEELKQKNQ